MNSQLEERIEIIKSLNTTGKADQLLEKRIKSSRVSGIFYYTFSTVFLIILVILTITLMFNMGHLGGKWQKFGLVVSLIFSMSIQAPFFFVDFLLSRHLKKLQDSDFSIDNHLNDTLKMHIDNLNQRRFKPYWIKIPALIISIVGLIQAVLVLNDSEILNIYWDYFKLPVLIVTLLILWYSNRIIYLVWENIKSVELSAKD